ncbi:unnamed protein product [Periconia digitata]|uniref:Uncharacterized protein n=1 Tax=Periconia digitata TaxID=1303443 RepID=A0A9W4URS0_9PLEO|nr:unnamed protein product [Periconia digitata]
MGVSVTAGATTLIAIPNSLHSCLSARISPTTPCLAAEYMCIPAAPTYPATLAVITINPPAAPFMPR